MKCTAITFTTSTSPDVIETVHWSKKAGKGPTALAYPIRHPSEDLQTKEHILAGQEAIEVQAKPEEYQVVQWWKLHLAEEYVEAARNYGGRYQDLADVKTYYTDFLCILYDATKRCLESKFQEFKLNWSDLRVRIELIWPSHWSQVTKATYMDCIKASGFGRHANHQICMTFDEARAAAEYASEGVQKISSGQHLLVCDASGRTTDMCVVKARANENNRFDLCLAKKSVCLGGTDVDQKLVQLLLGKLKELQLPKDEMLAIVERARTDVGWLGIKKNFELKDQSETEKHSLRLLLKNGRSLQDSAAANLKNGRVYFFREDLTEVFAEPLRKLRDVIIRTWEEYPQDIVGF